MKFALCPHSGDESAFCLVLEDDFFPFQHGPLAYLNVDGRLDEALKVVSTGGGKLLSKERVDPYGFRAIIYDTEGNRIALHSY